MIRHTKPTHLIKLVSPVDLLTVGREYNVELQDDGKFHTVAPLTPVALEPEQVEIVHTY